MNIEFVFADHVLFYCFLTRKKEYNMKKNNKKKQMNSSKKLQKESNRTIVKPKVRKKKMFK